jgi:hypothetical protein
MVARKNLVSYITSRSSHGAVALLAILVSLLGACGGAGKTAYAPVHQKTAHADDVLFNAALNVLEAHDYRTLPDREQQTLRTREQEVAVSSVPKLSYYYAWEITTRDSTLSIQASCRENSAMARTEFTDCGAERPERIVLEQEKLRQEILERAKKAEAADKD